MRKFIFTAALAALLGFVYVPYSFAQTSISTGSGEVRLEIAAGGGGVLDSSAGVYIDPTQGFLLAPTDTLNYVDGSGTQQAAPLTASTDLTLNAGSVINVTGTHLPDSDTLLTAGILEIGQQNGLVLNDTTITVANTSAGAVVGIIYDDAGAATPGGFTQNISGTGAIIVTGSNTSTPSATTGVAFMANLVGTLNTTPDVLTVDYNGTLSLTGDMTVTSSGAGIARGFAANILSGSATFGNINTTTNNASGLSGESMAVDLTGVSGTLRLGNVDVTAGNTNIASGQAIGLNLGDVTGTVSNEIGTTGIFNTITVNAIGSGANARGVHTQTLGNDAVLDLGDITVGSNDGDASGFVARGGISAGSAVSLNAITVTADQVAVGIDAADGGAGQVVAADSLQLFDDVTATSQNSVAYGVLAGSLENLDVNVNISASGAPGSYGILTDGSTGNSTINLDDDGVVTGTTAGISLGGTDDVVNINLLTELVWNNGGNAFVAQGVETINIQNFTTVDMVAGSSATGTNNTNIEAGSMLTGLYSSTGNLNVSGYDSLVNDTGRVTVVLSGGSANSTPGITANAGTHFAGTGSFDNGALLFTVPTTQYGRYEVFTQGFNGQNSLDNANRSLMFQHFTDPIRAGVASNFVDGGGNVHGVITQSLLARADMSDAYVNSMLMHDPFIWKAAQDRITQNFAANSFRNSCENGRQSAADNPAPGKCGATDPAGKSGQSTARCCPGNTITKSFWANYVGRSSSLESSYVLNRNGMFGNLGENRIYDDIDYSSHGVQLGFDLFANRCTQLGLVFGYERQSLDYNANPQMLDLLNFNMGLAGGTGVFSGGDNVKAEDYYVGLYGARMVANDSDVRAFFGYGHQKYDMQRNAVTPIPIPQPILGVGRYDSSFDGDTFEGTLELGQRSRWSDTLSFRPVLGLDFYHNSINGTNESSPTIQLSGGAFGYDDASLTQLSARVGTSMQYNCNRLNLNGGLYYSYQVLREGDTIKARVTDSLGDSAELIGIDLGNSLVTGNLGTTYYLNSHRSIALFGNYYVDCYADREGTPWTHTGQAGVLLRY